MVKMLSQTLNHGRGSRLEHLNLSRNRIGEMGANALSQSCHNIEVLNLNENHIGDQGLLDLVRLFRYRLCRLSVRDNSISEMGFSEFLSSFSTEKSLSPKSRSRRSLSR